MQQEDLKKSRRLFTMKTIHMPKHNSSNASMNLLDTKNLDFSIDMLLKKNEEIIIAYLERVIYTSNLSKSTNEQIQTLFNNVKAQMMLTEK